MSIFRKLLILSLISGTFMLSACRESETENAVEDAGESIEQTAEDVKDASEDAAEEAEDAAEDAADEVEDTVE